MVVFCFSLSLQGFTAFDSTLTIDLETLFQLIGLLLVCPSVKHARAATVRVLYLQALPVQVLVQQVATLFDLPLFKTVLHFCFERPFDLLQVSKLLCL